jgi:hypothetical protein
MSAFFIVLLGGKGGSSSSETLVGVSAFGSVGNVIAGSGQFADLAGVFSTAVIGQVQVLSSVNVALTGVSAQAQLGNESVQIGGNITTVVSGVSSSAQIGNVLISNVRNTSVSITGVSATAVSGIAAARSSLVAQVTGVSALASSSSIGVIGGASTTTNAVSATGAIGSVEAGEPLNYVGSSGSWSGKSPSLFVSMYPWTTSGFGAKYAEPEILPPAVPSSMASTPSGKSVAVGWQEVSGALPFVNVYQWSESGFGAKFSDPSTSLLGGFGLTFNPDSSVIAISMANTFPRIAAYEWSDITGWGTRFSALGFDLVGLPYPGKFSSDGASLLFPHGSSPFITAFPWFNSGPGTKFANPSTLPTNVCASLSLNASQNKVAVSQRSSPYMHEYEYSSSSGWGVKSSNPSSPLTSISEAVSYHPTDDAYVVFGQSSSPWVVVYQNYSVRLSNPAQLPFGTIKSITFSKDGNTLFLSNLTNSSTPSGLLAYEWNNGIGVRYMDPAISYGVTIGGATTFI